MPKKRKIFLPFAPSCLAEISELIMEGEVYYTCADTEMTLEAIAPSVVSCAESLGAIEMLVYAPELTARGELFLDLVEEDFTAHTAALNGLFMLCKCALPYMMGGESPEIVIVRPRGQKNLTSDMYGAAVSAIAESMNNELAEYGVRVRLS